jgi:hypothetical protein
MIDYEKLKEYLETKRLEKHKTCLESQFDNGYLWAIKDLESFIRDEELTKPEPKYKRGDTVFWLYKNEIIDARIEGVSTIDKRGINYFLGDPVHGGVFEKYLYPTRQALIEAQIKYWSDLKAETVMVRSEERQLSEFGPVPDRQCQHESDGFLYDYLKDKKCKHCGESHK